MFESDSVQTDNTSTDFSESDSKKNIKNLRINELYDELMKENQLLRAQFEEAVNITAQMEDLHKQNSTLLGQVRDLKAEKDDLLHRLDILVQKDKENANKLQLEKFSSTAQRGCDLNSMNKEIEKIKIQSKEQLDSIYAQLEASEQAREKESVDKRLLLSKLDRVIGEASRFFETTFNSIDEVFDAFSGPKICIGGSDNQLGLPVQVQIRNAVAQKDAENQKKVHRLKTKIAECDKAKESLEDEIKKMQRESQLAQQQARSEAANLHSQIDNLRDVLTANERQYEANIQKYHAQNEALKSELNKLKDKNKSLNDDKKNLKRQVQMVQRQAATATANANQARLPVIQTDLSESEMSTTSTKGVKALHPRHDPELEAMNDKLQVQVAELREEAIQAAKKKDQILQVVKEKDNEIHNLGIQIEKQKNEYAALDTVHQETLLEVESLRAALLTREKAKDEIKNAPKVKTPNPTVVKLQKSLDQQKQKFYALQIVSGKQDTRIQDQEAEIRHLSVRTRDLEADLARVKAENNELRASIENRHLPTADDLLPPAAFRCEDFTPELSTHIAKIVNNTSLQPASKIQNSYKAIRKYYSKQLALRDAAIDGAYSENQTISNAVNQFLVDASIALCDQPVTFNDFFAANAGKDIVDKISAIRAENASLIHVNDIMKAALVHLKETFIEIGDPSDPIGHINSIKEKLEQLNSDLCSRNKKIRQYKTNLAEAQSSAKRREEELLTENQSLKFNVEDLSQQVKKLHDEINNIRSQQHTLGNTIGSQKLPVNVDFSDVNNRMPESSESVSVMNDPNEQFQVANEELNSQLVKLRDQLRAQKEQYDHLEVEYNDACDQLDRVKKQLQLIKAQKLQKDIEYDELVKSCAEKEEAAANRLESEKQHLADSYESALSKLHEQCEQHRQDVEKINQSLAEEQIKVANLKSTLAKVEKEKLKAVADMQSTKNQMKREKILMESTIRSNKLQAEAQYNERLEEYKGRSEADKRSLLAFGADSFRDFFNPGTTIDERSYKYVIEKAHEKLVNLAKSDAHVRRMVSASDHQTTEDAVAQLLLNSA
ncbi:hypothetical protein M9Y10_009348 [Tritrichomonas musculus]|uniref:Uncharacterized protein n=1 Tax=Tritrichomonas musculus TaxID=1915356 RepID=A0ABR2IPM7_9EUKA